MASGFQKIVQFPNMLIVKLRLIFQRVVSYAHVIVSRPVPFLEDGLFTIANHDFIDNERFKRAYAAGKATRSWGKDIHWRAYLVAWAANKGAALEGDFVECGVNRGGTAMVAAVYVDFGKLNKTFYLLDTYKGLDDRFVTDEEKARGVLAHEYSECYEAVKNTFKDFSNVRIIRGSVPDTLPQVAAQRISYLSIDMNNKVPEIAAAEYFWDKCVSGAVIILDDYGWSRHLEQKKAFDDFAAQRAVEVLSLPTGQGLIIKP